MLIEMITVKRLRRIQRELIDIKRIFCHMFVGLCRHWDKIIDDDFFGVYGIRSKDLSQGAGRMNGKRCGYHRGKEESRGRYHGYDEFTAWH